MGRVAGRTAVGAVVGELGEGIDFVAPDAAESRDVTCRERGADREGGGGGA